MTPSLVKLTRMHNLASSYCFNQDSGGSGIKTIRVKQVIIVDKYYGTASLSMRHISDFADALLKGDVHQEGKSGEPPVVAEADLRGERPVPEEDAGRAGCRRLLPDGEVVERQSRRRLISVRSCPRTNADGSPGSRPHPSGQPAG